MVSLDQLVSQIRFQLEQMSARNAHHDFEHLCRFLARERICSNILPATGPVAYFGDQGRDFETFRTYLNDSTIANSSFVGMISKGPIAFACSLTGEDGIIGKIKSDVKTIMESGTPVVEIHYFCTVDIPSGVRHKKLQSWVKEEYDVFLEIHDGQAISEHLISQDIFWIAVKFLNIPAEIFPEIPVEDSEHWYDDILIKWDSDSIIPINYADFVDIKSALRHATFNDSTKKDLPFWIEKAEALLKSTSHLPLKRKLFYEIAVASLRGLGSMIGYEDRINDYFNDVNRLTEPSELEDAVNLWNYCIGSIVNNQSQLVVDDLIPWRKEIIEKVEQELQSADKPGIRCLLLEIKGFLYLIPVPNIGEKYLEDLSLDVWLELASIVDDAYLFPLEQFADRLTTILELSEYLPNIGTNPKFELLTRQIDEKLAVRHGGFVAAKKCRDRAMVLYKQGNIIGAIKEIHKAKIKWFANETLRGSILAMLFLSKCYLELKLAFAAKYYALVAAYIADISTDDYLKRYIPGALLESASCDYSIGAYFSFFEFTDLGLQAYSAYSVERSESFFDEYVKKSIYYATFIRSIAKILDTDFVNLIDKQIERWVGLEEYFEEAIPLAEETWGQYEISDLWLEIEKQKNGKPFSDIGKTRFVEFNALGISWIFEWENIYELNMFSEEILAVLQIFIADLANIDLCLLRTKVKVEIAISEEDEFVIQEIPSNDIGYWRLSINQNGSLEEIGQFVVGIIASLLEYVSLLPAEKFLEKIDKAFNEGLSSKIVFGQQYSVLYRKYFGKEIFEKIDRKSFEQPLSEKKFNTTCHPEFSWCNDMGPGYSTEGVLEALRKRYKLSVIPIKHTIKWLSNQVVFQDTLEKLRNDGWLDWHVLTAVGLLVINYRLNEKIDFQSNSEEYNKQFLIYTKNPEDKNDIPIPLEEFSEENLRFHLWVSMVSTIKGLGLELHQTTPNFDVLSDFLGVRYKYWEDDIEHPEYGF